MELDKPGGGARGPALRLPLAQRLQLLGGHATRGRAHARVPPLAQPLALRLKLLPLLGDGPVQLTQRLPDGGGASVLLSASVLCALPLLVKWVALGAQRVVVARAPALTLGSRRGTP